MTRPVGAFLAIAFGVAWAIWGAGWALGAFAAGTSSVAGQALVAIGSFSPALAAVVVRRWIGHEGSTDGLLRLHLRRGWPMYLFAWLLPVMVTGFVVVVAQALGASFVHKDLTPGMIASAIVAGPLLGALAIGEEFGWRGYLQRRWFGHRLLVAATLTGIAWGVYHYPVILLGFEGYEQVTLGLLIFPLFAIFHSVILGWLVRRSGSIWTSCLAHGSANAFGGSILAYLFYGGGQWMLLSYVGLVALVPLALVAAWIAWTDQWGAPRLAQRSGGAATTPSR